MPKVLIKDGWYHGSNGASRHLVEAPSKVDGFERLEYLGCTSYGHALMGWFTKERYTLRPSGNGYVLQVYFHWDDGRTSIVYYSNDAQVGLTFDELYHGY